jgi:leader peptidase (prepilin peptidase)/N-methyltransferase
MTIDFVIALAGPIYLLAVAWPLTRIDLRERRLPNRFVLPAFPIAVASQLFACAISGEWWRIAVSLAFAAVALLVGMLANRTTAMGMGDVKLIAAMFLCLGWFNVISPLISLAIGFVAAAAVVLVMVALRRSTLGSTIALGPYLLLGFVGAFTQMLT